MSLSLFIKMSREEGALERLLEKVRCGGCEIVDMTARRSLDNTFFFVRLGVEGTTETESLRDELNSLNDVLHLDVEPDSFCERT